MIEPRGNASRPQSSISAVALDQVMRTALQAAVPDRLIAA